MIAAHTFIQLVPFCKDTFKVKFWSSFSSTRPILCMQWQQCQVIVLVHKRLETWKWKHNLSMWRSCNGYFSDFLCHNLSGLCCCETSWSLTGVWLQAPTVWRCRPYSLVTTCYFYLMDTWKVIATSTTCALFSFIYYAQAIHCLDLVFKIVSGFDIHSIMPLILTGRCTASNAIEQHCLVLL